MVSVALGDGAAHAADRRQEAEVADRALEAIGEELDHNLRVLEPLVPVHQRWVEFLAAPDTGRDERSAIDVFFATRPTLPAGSAPFPLLRRNAWDAALSGGVLRLIEFDTRAALSDVYRVQEIVTENVNRLAEGALSDVAVYQPESRAAAVRLPWLSLADITAAELRLLSLYRHLPQALVGPVAP